MEMKMPVGAECSEEEWIKMSEEDQKKVIDACGKKKPLKADSVQRNDLLDLPWYLEKPFERTPEGFLTGRAVVTCVGVFEYRDANGAIKRELRLPEEVFAFDSLESLKLKPVTNDHPSGAVTPDNVKALQVGNTGTNPSSTTQRYSGGDGYARTTEITDGLHLAIDLSVQESQAIEDVLNGKRALSCGYTCDLEAAQPGARYLGMAYDAIQRKIRYNHVALVDVARAGDSARIRLDSIGSPVNIEHSKEESMEYKTVKLDGADFQAEAPVIQAYTKATERADAAEKQVQTLSTEKSKLEAERDSYKEKVDGLTKDLEKAKADSLDQGKIDAAVAERLSLLDAAQKADVKADGLSPEDLKKAIITKVFPSAKLDGKDAVYVQARFDAAVETLAETAQTDAKTRTALKGDKLPDGEEKKDSAEKYDSAAARERYVAKLNGEK